MLSNVTSIFIRSLTYLNSQQSSPSPSEQRGGGIHQHQPEPAAFAGAAQRGDSAQWQHAAVGVFELDSAPPAVGGFIGGLLHAEFIRDTRGRRPGISG